jgi:tetratricopeptide (TPR) repeat protein
MSHRPFRKATLGLLLAIGFMGCVGQGSARRPDKGAREVVLEPMVIGVRPDAELGLTDFDAAALFQEGLRHQAAEQCEKALVFYRRLRTDFPGSRYLSATAFNSGRCLETLSRAGEAVDSYRIITQTLPASKDWIDAAFRETLCLVDLARRQEAVDLLERLLARPGLTLPDRIDALVLQGEALVGLGETGLGERRYRTALRLFREHEREEYLDPTPAARAEFRLADLAVERFRSAPLRLPESQMESDLEVKAQALLEAQAGFLRAMRFGVPEWATAGGFRIGSLYVELHRALQDAPVPQDLTEEEIAVYRDLLKSRLAVLLRKALRLFEMTLSLAERSGSDNEWTRLAREELARVEKEVLSQLEPLPSPAAPAPPGPGAGTP